MQLISRARAANSSPASRPNKRPRRTLAERRKKSPRKRERERESTKATRFLALRAAVKTAALLYEHFLTGDLIDFHFGFVVGLF
jgi:hypothetical protein